MDVNVEVLVGNQVQYSRKIPNNGLINKTTSIKKRQNYEEDLYSEEEEEEDSSASFEAMDEDIDEEDKLDNFNAGASEPDPGYSQRKLLRRYGTTTTEEEHFLHLVSGNKKPKKILSEEEIAKKTEQSRIRKLHAKKLLEEEKREAVERILNEDGRKLRERQKKLQEETLKKSQAREEKYRFSLTEIKHKYCKNGSVYVRFPQGFRLPAVLLQKRKELKPTPKCDKEGCKNIKKYTDPLTKKHYCSVECFKAIRADYEKENKMKLD